MQVTSAATGAAAQFGLSYGGTTDFTVVSQAADAKLTVGTAPFSFTLTSTTNTFDDVLEGTSLTVSKKSTSAVTIDVGANTAAATSAMQSLVSAANAVLTKIGAATDSSPGSVAALKGNYAMTSLASQVLTAVSSAVGGDGSAVGNGSSAAVAGLELTRDGKLKFDSGVFNAKLTADPTLVQGLFGGKLDVGTDNVAGTVDDVLATDGIGARLQRLAQQASDSVSGTLTVLANGQDTRAKDLTKQIADWDLRLASRQTSLTKQFNAMESALGALQNQASWLSSQLNSLPSWSSNS
jgi:flagellar hook-associated protein 2